MKTLFSYFQQFFLPKVLKTHLQADFVTNNQILVVKVIKIRAPLLFRPPAPPPPLIRFYEFFRPPRFIKIPPSIRDLRVNLSEKKNKDETFIENWRPISVLNVDVKLISKTLAIRFKHFLPILIFPNPTANITSTLISEEREALNACIQ